MVSLPTFLSLISLLVFIFASPPTNSKPTKLTLTFTKPNQPNPDPIENLISLAQSTISRAKHLKSPKPKPKKPKTESRTPLGPRGYGGYSVSLAFGTPPQKSELVFDTGSSLVWVPCTSRYICSGCEFSGVDPTKIPKFIPRESSSSVIVGCHNPMCHWIFGPKPNCDGNRTITGCPAYVIQYGSGSTEGILISDAVDLPGRPVPRFLIGCSLVSIRQPSGIAGFGRGPESLPSQLALSKFSYCLLSHRFDDSSVTSDLVLDGDEDGAGIQYTPFQDNPGKVGSPFKEYYYVMLRRVFVGGRRVKIPYRYLEPKDIDAGGGGTVVDSGSTFTFMERAIHDVVAGEFLSQMKGYKRAYDVENRTGLLPCFDLSEEKESVRFPELVFQFKGGAKMVLPLSNYFSLVGDGDVACLTVVTSGGSGPELSGGPAIILGNYQQMNFHVEYDLKNNRFGFKRQNCSSK